MALPKSAFEQVLNEVPEGEARDLASREAIVRWNVSGGRPSDAARAIVATYRSGGIEALREMAARTDEFVRATRT